MQRLCFLVSASNHRCYRQLWRVTNEKVYVVFVGFHDANIKIRIVGNRPQYSFDVIIKFSYKYLSPVFDAENQVTL